MNKKYLTEYPKDTRKNYDTFFLAMIVYIRDKVWRLSRKHNKNYVFVFRLGMDVFNSNNNKRIGSHNTRETSTMGTHGVKFQRIHNLTNRDNVSKSIETVSYQQYALMCQTMPTLGKTGYNSFPWDNDFKETRTGYEYIKKVEWTDEMQAEEKEFLGTQLWKQWPKLTGEDREYVKFHYPAPKGAEKRDWNLWDDATMETNVDPSDPVPAENMDDLDDGGEFVVQEKAKKLA